jgi:NitT/TauT family transport system permease protein
VVTTSVLESDVTTPGVVRRAPRRMNTALDRSIGVLSVVAGMAIWEVAGRALDVAWLPPFTAVIGALFDLIDSGQLQEALKDSLTNLGIGFGIALVIGLVVGALMGRYRLVHEALHGYVYALFVSPTMIFVPIFFALFGLTNGTRIAVIVVYAVFVMIINTSTAFRDVDRSLEEMARSYGAKEHDIIFRVIAPASIPLVMAGIQLGVGRAVKGMINGEMFIALVGLGALSRRYGGRFDADAVFAIVLVVLLLALALHRIVRLLDRRFTRWL